MAEQCSIQYGKSKIDFTVVRRKRATMEIAVEPDTSVVVAAPLRATVQDIEAKVRKRAAWVRRQQKFFSSYLPKTPERYYVPGETHLYLGRQYRLKVVHSAKTAVKLIRGFIVVYSQDPGDAEVTRMLVDLWYRERAHVKFEERLGINIDRFPDPKKYQPKGMIIRQLRQRWGSMSPSKRLLLNRRLIQAPVDAIDYVIIHELCHIDEPNHSTAFFELLDRILPDWRKRKERLEKIMA